MLILTKRDLPRRFSVHSVYTAEDSIRPDGFYFNGEIHDFWEIVCIIDGSASITADERTFILANGQITFHKPMEFHRIWSDKAFHILLLTFYAEGEGMEFFNNKVFNLEPEQIIQLHSIVKKTIVAINNSEKGEVDHTLTHIVAAEIELFLLNLISNNQDNVGLLMPKSSESYKKIVQTMENHIGKNLSQQELAYLCNMSVSNLKKTFKRFSDKSVMSYMRSLKITHAMRWLKEGMSASEISSRLGYSDPSYFYVVFKRETGMTTGEYVQKSKGLW